MSQFIDPLAFCIALAPLAAYLFLIGFVNVTARAWVWSGARDAGLLGAGLMGFALVGPMSLFLPSATAFRLGGWVWLLFAAFYGLSISLYVLLIRPRIVIYNVGESELRAVLVQLAQDVDSDSRWAGECLHVPKLGIELHLESFGAFRNMRLVATSSAQDLTGWNALQRELSKRLRPLPARRNLQGASLIASALLITAAMILAACMEPQALAMSFQQMLRGYE